jgi:hypothetical protein
MMMTDENWNTWQVSLIDMDCIHLAYDTVKVKI